MSSRARRRGAAGRRSPAVQPSPAEVELRLESLAFGGAAVGRYEGRAVFVPFGAPGDLVRVRLSEPHARWARAELIEVLEPGAARRLPACPLAGRCGGCPWQQVDYAAQLAAKREILGRALRRVAPPTIEFVAAPEELHYRRRVRLHWQRGPSGFRLGFRGWRSRELIDVEACPLLVPALGRALGRLRAALAVGPVASGTLAVLAGAEHACHFSLRVARGGAAGGAPWRGDGWLGDGIVGGLVTEANGATHALGLPDVALDPRGLRAHAACFTQAHAAQDAALAARVQALSAVAAGRAVLELYAGCGNLTAALGQHAASVLAVESDAAAVALLGRNRARIGAALELRAQGAAEAVRELAAQRAVFPLILLDPPREGARELIEGLAQLGAERILYVSCDPLTLARDLSALAPQGYRATSVVALDTMPQTHHFEVLAALERRA